MELRVLRTFVTVAEQRHFARAATLCNLSQPAVSHQIALLEEELGARLLNRTGRRVSLTVAGEVFLEEARRILASVDRAMERMQEVARGAVGRIRIGASPTPGLYLLPAVLARFKTQHPTYELRFELGASHDLLDRVSRNELDMAVVADHVPADLRGRSLATDDLVIVAAPRSEIAARAKRVRPSQLGSVPWIIREEGSETRRQTAAWWHRHRLAPSSTMTFAGPDAVKRAVAAGLGIAMVSRMAARDELKRRVLTEVPVAAALPERTFQLVDHPYKHHGAACRAMLHLFERLPAQS